MDFLKDLWGFLKDRKEILAVAAHHHHVDVWRPDRVRRQLRPSRRLSILCFSFTHWANCVEKNWNL